jgi:putative DNA primase/helicase
MNQDRIHGEDAGHSDSKPEHKKSFAERVAHKLIEQLKAGTAPWQLPWKPGAPHAFLPMNPTTGKRYKGINALQLASEGHNDPRWMTYKQASAMGAQIRKGEKGTPIQYWKFNEEEQSMDQHGSPLKEMVLLERPRVFLATVFNAEQMDGLPPLAQQRHENEG